MLSEVRSFRLDEELVDGHLAAFLTQEEGEIGLEGIPIGEVINGEMPLVAEEVDFVVLFL